MKSVLQASQALYHWAPFLADNLEFWKKIYLLGVVTQEV